MADEQRDLAVREPVEVEAQPVTLGMDPHKYKTQMVEIDRAMTALAIAVTRPRHWVQMGEEAYMCKAGCETMCQKFGISTHIISDHREIGNDEVGEFWSYEYKVRASVQHPLTGRVMEAERTGTASTKDKFFGWRNGQRLPLSEVDTANVKKKAETNAFNRAIKAVLGFHPTWEELQSVFQSRSGEGQSASVQYNQDAARSSGKGVVTDDKKRIAQLCFEMAHEDKEHAANLLEAWTAFTIKSGKDQGKEIPGVRSVKDLSDKRAKVTLRIVEEKYQKFLAEEGGEREPGEEG